MIKKFGCKNIKAIREYSEIDIRPITIIMGENSSGKSSLLQGLSLLAVNKIFGNDIRRIKYNNPFSNFGDNDSFKNRGENIELFFEVENKDKNKDEIKLIYADEEDNNEYGYLQNITIKNKIFEIEFIVDNLIKKDIKEKHFLIKINKFNLDKYDFLREVFDGVFIGTNLKTITHIQDNSNSKYEMDIVKHFGTLFNLSSIFLEPLKILSKDLENLYHVGSTYQSKATYDYPLDYIGYFWEKYKDVALSLKNTRYLKGAVRDIFNYELIVDKTKQELFIELNKKKLNLKMFGTSVQNTIPILTQFAKNREKEIRDKYKLTIIEEPEINEHPLSQAKLVEVLFKNQPKNQFNIIETHSDHIINKLCYLVAKKIIKNDDVIIYYKKRDENKFYKIEINKCGKFTSKEFGEGGFPDGFFDATLNDLFELGNDC